MKNKLIIYTGAREGSSPIDSNAQILKYIQPIVKYKIEKKSRYLEVCCNIVPYKQAFI